MTARLMVGPEARRTAHRDIPVRCPACDRVVPRNARHQRFCSTRCREREKAQKRVWKLGLGPSTQTTPDPQKFVNKNKGRQSRKWRPRSGISAAATAIRAELFGGRKWEPVTSSDGVRCLIARKGDLAEIRSYCEPPLRRSDVGAAASI